MKPHKGDYIPYFEYYINLVKQENILEALTINKNEISAIISTIPEEKSNYCYAENKWSIKQLLNHINDTERILCYRALRFSRGDNQLVNAFDENAYAANANLTNSNITLLGKEFECVRDATFYFFKQLDHAQLNLKGQMVAGEVSVLALGFMICGHALHHTNILKERYL